MRQWLSDFDHWMIRRRDDCSVDPSSHHIILKIVGFLTFNLRFESFEKKWSLHLWIATLVLAVDFCFSQTSYLSTIQGLLCGWYVVCVLIYSYYIWELFKQSFLWQKESMDAIKSRHQKSLMMVLVMCAFRVSITIRYRHSHFLNPRNYDAGVMITDWFDNYNIQSCAKKYRKLVCME